MSSRNITMALFITTSLLVACSITPASKASSPTPCGVGPAAPATSSASAEAAGAPGLWSFDGSTWAWLANEPPPGPRITNIGVSGGIAYDSGASSLINVNETGTHVWDGKNWLDTGSDAGPSPRLDSQLAYDPARHVVVLFGGREYHPNGGINGKYLNDTWTWDGRLWHQKTPSLSPDFGFDAANMAWDDADHVLLLFGAIRDQASDQVVSVTWQWNGTEWSQVLASTSPPQRFGAAMAFDGGRSNVVLFGGFGVSPERDFNDTWTWDGTTWAERFPAHIPTNTPTENGLPGPFAGPFTASAMAYDPAHKVVVLVTTDMGAIKTWTWDGSDWTQLQTAVSPRASKNMSMTYDTHSQRMLLVVFADPVPYFGPCQSFGVL